MTKLCEIKSVGLALVLLKMALSVLGLTTGSFTVFFFTQLSLDLMDFASFAHCILFLGKSLTRYI
jgi:hypothetical protein